MKKIGLMLLVAFVMVGCGGKKISPQEKRKVTTKTFNASCAKTFGSVMNVFQDEEYVIKSADKDSGLIVANSNKQIGEASRVFQKIMIGNAMKDGTRTNITATLRDSEKETCKTRISIQKVEYGTRGGMFNSSKFEDVKSVNNPRVYNDLFLKISKDLNL